MTAYLLPPGNLRAVVLGFVAGLLLAAAPAARGAAKPINPRLKPHRTRYYVIYTDLGQDDVREAAARMTAMAEEYRRRTRGFAGTIRSRMTFCLFSRPEDYRRAGGLPGSAGMYSPRRRLLMARATRGASEDLWRRVQHEAFHQFVHLVIRGRIPIWVNEGMAEYFGHGIWTGDGFVTGVIPPARLERLKRHIKADRLVSFEEMLAMTGDQWIDAVADSADDANSGDKEDKGRKGGLDPTTRRSAQVNYDQAWSMVHFLVHAEDGRYRKAFSAFINDVSRGSDWKGAFDRRFGANLEAFEKRYRQWWLAQDQHPTWPLYTKAVVATMTSFLARAASQGQTFRTVEEFFDAAEAGRLECNAAQWLPPTLLRLMLMRARSYRGWSLETTGRWPKLVKRSVARTFTGTFTCTRGRASNVQVTITETRPLTAPKGPTRER